MRAALALGKLLDEQGREGESEQWWRKAAVAGDLGAMIRLADLLLKRGKWREANRWQRKSSKEMVRGGERRRWWQPTYEHKGSWTHQSWQWSWGNWNWSGGDPNAAHVAAQGAEWADHADVANQIQGMGPGPH